MKETKKNTSLLSLTLGPGNKSLVRSNLRSCPLPIITLSLSRVYFFPLSSQRNKEARKKTPDLRLSPFNQRKQEKKNRRWAGFNNNLDFDDCRHPALSAME